MLAIECDMLASPDRNGASHSISPFRKIRLVPCTSAGRSPVRISAPIAAGPKLRMGEPQIVVTFGDVVGKFVGKSKAEPAAGPLHR